MFFNKTVVVAIISALAVQGLPTEEVTEGVITLLRKPLPDGGALVYYGGALNLELEPAPALNPRQQCGTSLLNCDTAHAPPGGPCQQLISSTRNDPSFVLPQSSTSVCREDGSGRCCISWNAPLSNLRQGSLTNAAQFALERCVLNRASSGKTTGVELQGRCVNQCLSNRPDGCT